MVLEEDVVRFFNNGDFSDERLCYKYFAEIRWSEGVKCERCLAKGIADTEMVQYEFGTKSYKPYSYRCHRCGTYYSPTHATLFASTNIRGYFEIAYWLLYQRATKRKLRNIDIKELMARNPKAFLGTSEINQVNISSIKRYRHIIQQYALDWVNSKPPTYAPYGIIQFSLTGKGGVKEILVAAQLCHNGHIRASAYDEYSQEDVILFINQVVPNVIDEIHMVNWNRPADEILKTCAKAKMTTFQLAPRGQTGIETIGLLDSRHVVGLEKEIRKWFKGLDLSNLQRVQLNLNEYLFISKYEYLTVFQLLKLMIGLPITFSEPLK